jgi:hypothetical protein
VRNPIAANLRKLWHQGLRKLFALFPRAWRFSVYRSFVQCDPRPDERLQLKIAETQEELQACFKLLHDAYVASGFMKPDPSGMRVTTYHALPTTTTLCAKYDGEVVGTMSLIRESVFGFPLQAIFDLEGVRQKGGKIAEVSALAVHPKFRKTGGAILFPLMKFMYEYCTTFFDTRHLVIAVHPSRIEMYESLLFFERLEEMPVKEYDFANGAPAVGATLDLRGAPELLKGAYGAKPRPKNLYDYFVKLRLRNIQMPNRRYFTTNDPVLTPELMDYFFNQQTQGFQKLDERERVLLHSIYNLPEYKAVLPPLFSDSGYEQAVRQHQRYSTKIPAHFRINTVGEPETHELRIIQFSNYGFLAHSKGLLPTNVWGTLVVQLGNQEQSTVKAMALRGKSTGNRGFYVFKLVNPDLAWRKFVGALTGGTTHADLENATKFLRE